MSDTDNKDIKDEAVHEDDVMITTKMSDLEKMLESVESHADKRTDSKFERFFVPSLLVFSLLAFGGFMIIYSITQDMTRLASAMDPKMGSNMSSMVVSIDNLSKNVAQMSQSVEQMRQDFSSVSKNMSVVAKKLDNLDDISTNMTQINTKMSALKPMLVNMQKMNSNMIGMQKSMQWMQKDISQLRSSFNKPMRVFNAVPFL
ncbi:hypothetical protein BTHERMOSOX_1486 [Bathymodiolus thermophilus thioautotrophic gill symbiont]|uniref:Uncharacterized protein n=1 Tax=Bathymodiolus thermophilus thioautotrophic gill symbiont TaxID=2360 RepID=A0A1J5UES8_9GAMM|nr:hypothetical protein [Bathymodiolus thermophilus thioautotrophic gill symbiont]AYQ57238.1 hypothetical protein MS2017_1554 [Bathymodiolus thermophilus thioautotrophic gill symbiont]OIR24429.1 hypothetical protein BGC33_10450 [Bathymodiolus thermophilus thioautotrophic gill symbiont]CAB5494554.1 hypothetical protein THERMOS_131 [Bathymodiolus thermophilus thioautotrophic gill symbiont]CAB5505074.1 hypothetical protein THERMOT_2088 [Bathymodiolus thermophilus thioautotrophic gill symbiont]SGZ